MQTKVAATTEIPLDILVTNLDTEDVSKSTDTYNPAREIFILSYKKGHTVIEMKFQSDSLKMAVEKGRDLCFKRKWRFIVVTPFLRDIDKLLNNQEIEE